jgi:two-component system nitrogen regulation sensor histidine kinase NtrY
MAFSGFQTGILIRMAGLLAILALVAWMATHTSWYVTTAICGAAAIVQAVLLTRYCARAGREVARFLDSIAFDDTSASFVA